MTNKKLTLKEIERNYFFHRGGFCAAVYNKSDTEVFRVSCVKHDGWRAILEIPEDLRESFGLVRVKEHWRDGKFVIAVLERLVHLNYKDTIKADFNPERFNRFKQTPNVDDILTPDNQFYEICKKATKALDYCKENNLNVHALDLNFLNIMQRENGELVLSDPFGRINKGIKL